MKKLLVLALVCLSMVVVTVMGTIAHAEEQLLQVGEDQLIRVGDYNDDVIALHQKMSDLGLYGLRPESPWGPASVESLKVLQGVLGLDETGVVSDQYEFDALLAADIDIDINLATGTENPVTVAPVGSNSWCNPVELYPTSEEGLIVLTDLSNKFFAVAFDWKTTGADTPVNASIELRFKGDKMWYAPVGNFYIPVGDAQGHCMMIFTPTDDMRQFGYGWLIGEIGSEVNRDMKVTLSNFMFFKCIDGIAE